jgi:hypothetical protein
LSCCDNFAVVINSACSFAMASSPKTSGFAMTF